MSETIKVLLSEEEVDARIRQIAAKISKDYAGKEIHMICVLKGGVFFTCELAKTNYCSGIPGLSCLFPVTVMIPSPAAS